MKYNRFRQNVALTAAWAAFARPSVATILLWRPRGEPPFVESPEIRSKPMKYSYIAHGRAEPLLFTSRDTFSSESGPKRLDH